ncbi:MAG: SDR family oxidoreductase [Pseudomonadota bacterium]|jgi:nucleoside-diphosphate-sugar epimerase
MILVTGSSGFVGAAAVQALLAAGQPVRAAVRQRPGSEQAQAERLEWLAMGAMTGQTNWLPALQGVQTVVHCAARAHVLREQLADPLAAYRAVNVHATLRLAEHAAAAGVRRFVFISSVKVNGESTQPGQPFAPADAPAPQDAYGLSKFEAEQALWQVARDTGMEVVIIRPPLVYGPGVKGNFARMVQWVRQGVPLPLGAVHNRRSLVALDNLVDFIALCASPERSPQAANQTFLVSDGDDVSTTELLRRVAHAYGVPARLLPVPVGLMRGAARLLGKDAVADRLFGSLQVDASKASDLLGWVPPVTMQAQLCQMALFQNDRQDV